MRWSFRAYRGRCRRSRSGNRPTAAAGPAGWYGRIPSRQVYAAAVRALLGRLGGWRLGDEEPARGLVEAELLDVGRGPGGDLLLKDLADSRLLSLQADRRAG